MIVRMSQENINKGIQKDCENCPVSLAMTDAGYKDVRTNAYLISYTDPNGKKEERRTNNEICTFIIGYDCHGPSAIEFGHMICPIEFDPSLLIPYDMI